ncbi:hypothetical protein [Litorihabitans aurantiacus]|uniref:Uncharacterized protein n=1 Tax=Litorihabitans aurantiacus TaxID=1930061 RepID=A0AA37XCD6_9MICO|nr:hypothetical protein [Litorihabitans aurantiacus]GMA30016.1 hypothetical protein GCM10025875_00080 [Litorihabitans aurantiacus]GMA33464.1 hypothetical protein GCM10025875_34560 [Litorihabitans aurantiacus]
MPFGGPGGPGGPNGPGGSGGSRKLPLAAIIGIVVGVVALIVVVSLLLVLGGGSDDDDAEPTSTGTGTEAEAAGDVPEEIVQTFLDAIAAGDAQTALDLVDSSTGLDETLLTDEVLAASAAIAPITDIVVTPPTDDNPYGVEVEVAYQLGDTPVSTTVRLTGDGDGAYTLTSAGGSVYVPGSVSGVDVTVNGVPVTAGEDYDAFIGTYEIATTSTVFGITGETQAAITERFESASFSGLTVDLTEESVAAFHESVRAAVDECLASTTLEAGCGLAVPATLSDGTQLTDGTLTRTLSGDAELRIGDLDPTAGYDNPNFVRGRSIGGVSTTAECTKDGQVGTCDVLFGPSLGAPTVDFSTEPRTVVWN